MAGAAAGRGGWPRGDLGDELALPALPAGQRHTPPHLPAHSPDSGVLGMHGRAPSFEPQHNTQDLISVCQNRRPRLGEPIWPPRVPQPRKGGTEGERQVLLRTLGACAHAHRPPARLTHPARLSGQQPEAKSDCLRSASLVPSTGPAGVMPLGGVAVIVPFYR